MRTVFAKTVLQRMKQDKKIVFLTGDLGFGALDEIAAQCPENFINCGVAEQNMVSIAAGLSLEGYTVITYSIANFATLRCLEQIRNDVAYHKANVKIVAVGGGLSYGALGFSHHATEDLSIMRALPGISILCPSSDEEARFCTDEMLSRPGPAYIRLDKLSVSEENKKFENPPQWGSPRILVTGQKLAIVTAGGILTEALKVCDLGLKPTIITLPVLKPLDTKALASMLAHYELVVTLEENQRSGGLGSMVAEALADHNIQVRVMRLGIQDQFLSEVGSQEYLREQYGLNAKKIADIATDLN